jgi:hypothetical protein
VDFYRDGPSEVRQLYGKRIAIGIPRVERMLVTQLFVTQGLITASGKGGYTDLPEPAVVSTSIKIDAALVGGADADHSGGPARPF